MQGQDRSDAVPAHLAQLLDAAVASLSGTDGVRGIFLAGSVAAGRTDASSDLDLRALVDDARLDALVAGRRELPAAWGELLYTECTDGTHHCVSHFAGFAKVDVFYIGIGEFVPARWLSGPVRVLHDPDGLLLEAIDDLRQGPVEPTEVRAEEIERDVSTELATAAEALRKLWRGDALMAARYLQGLAERLTTDLGRAGTGEEHPIETLDPTTAATLERCLHRADRDADVEALVALIDVLERRHGAALVAHRLDAFAERHARALRELREGVGRLVARRTTR